MFGRHLHTKVKRTHILVIIRPGISFRYILETLNGLVKGFVEVVKYKRGLLKYSQHWISLGVVANR